MKEARFIAQNKEKWQEAETLLNSPYKDPEKLSNLFVQVVDDLSYSKTYYPNRSVRVYLNKIARQYFSIIYSHRKEKHNRFMLFWLDELPQIILYSKKQLFISFLIFLLALAIGAFSSANDPDFVRTILGENYVAMTQKNIEEGDPMAVYKQSHQVEMFLGITLNNLMVAFRTYVLGIFMGIGTLASLLYNGIMVGSFQYYFIERDLATESALTIWLHGTLEISSIILAGGAGLTLGSGLIFPGTYSRIQSLQISGIRSLKLMLGVTPVFVLAAIIESFLTRYTDAPVILKLLLIVLSATFIIGYFVVYPWMKARDGFTVPLKEVKLSPRNNEPVNFTRIKTNADILKDAFQFYYRFSNKILPWVTTVAVVLSIVSLFFQEESFIYIEQEWWLVMLSDMTFALQTPSPLFIAVNALATTAVLYRVLKLIDAESKKMTFSFDIKTFIQIIVVSALIYTAIYLGGWTTFFLILLLGVLIFAAFVQLAAGRNLGYGIAKAWSLFGKNGNQGASLQIAVMLLAFSSLLILSAPLLYMHTSVLQWNFVTSDVWAQKTIQFTETFIKTFSFYLVLPVMAASFAYLYYSLEEVENATHLKASIAAMRTGVSKKSRQ